MILLIDVRQPKRDAQQIVIAAQAALPFDARRSAWN
jgi:hypothetical protein